LLAPSVDADDGPHPVVVRLEFHVRPPAQIQNRQIVCPVNGLDPGTLWLSQRTNDLARCGYSCGYEFSNRGVRVILFKCSAAIFNKTFFFKHRSASLFRRNTLVVATTTAAFEPS